MSFKLVSISKVLTALRIITILSCFVPVLFLERIKDDKYVKIWMLACLLFFVFQLIFIRRYKIIGKINLQSDSIETEINGHKDFVNNIMDYEITIEYKGYKGGPTKGTYTPLLSLSFDEGIGHITLKGFNENIKYSFLSEKQKDLSKLIESISVYKTKGVKINLIE